MKKIVIPFITLFASCAPSIKLAIPEQFRNQSSSMKVNGARSNHMSFGNYKTSKIKRGLQVRYPGFGKGFLLENLVLNQWGLQKDEIIAKEKDKLRFSISDGTATAQVFAKETEVTRKFSYNLINGPGILNTYNRLQEYQYIFSAAIATDTLPGSKSWEMIMTNNYDRKKDTVNSIFTIINPGDNGFATNGSDTIFIRPLTIQRTENAAGKPGWLPIKLLSGYELRIDDGVIAVIDAIGSNVWMYNELDTGTRLIVSGISAALFARRIKDIKW